MGGGGRGGRNFISYIAEKWLPYDGLCVSRNKHLILDVTAAYLVLILKAYPYLTLFRALVTFLDY